MTNEEQSKPGVTEIKPATISLTSASSAQKSADTRKGPAKTVIIGFGFGVLFMSAAVVIFLLPRWVQTPDVETVATSGASSEPLATVRSKPKVAESPWEKAQESKLRKETQEILSQMLDAQKALNNHGVMIWAAEEYTKAMQYAEAGDILYNERDFLAARGEYEQALHIFIDLTDRVDEVFEEMMTAGNKALENNDSATAIASFDVALAIDAIDRDANIGKQRAETLDSVISLIRQGDKLLESNELEQAKASYQEALGLDEHSVIAKQQIQLADKKILDREFNRNMSSGFAALSEKRYEQARGSFNKALKIKPNSAEARAALKQTGQSITTIKINSLLAQAKKLEGVEKWHEALGKYNDALALNASLADAQAGRNRTNLRAKLHERLEQILANPTRLYDRAVYDETVSFHSKIRAISDRGPVLTTQLISLTELLSKALTPVSVILRSDNLTRVTVYKVGELGYFTDHELSLRPGPYVAVGHRDGYRDIRVEFMVDPDKPMAVITVQAQEKIALGK